MKQTLAKLAFISVTLAANAQSWTNIYNAPRGGTGASGLAVDSSGNVFVTGSSAANVFNPANYDYATIKYSAVGVPLWTNLYDGPVNDVDAATALAVSANGNVFVTGYSWNGFNNDYATVGYSNNGAALWTNRYNGPGNKDDYGWALAVDTNGNVFVTGASVGTNDNSDVTTIKYSSAGAALWTNRYNGPGNGADYAKSAAVDRQGNVFVAGRSWNGTSQDYVTIGYSNNGVGLWTNRYNGPGNGLDQATAVGVDGNGNVFVTGESLTGVDNADYVTLKYSAAGVPLWTNRYDGPGGNYDGALALAVDPVGNVLVTGESAGSDFYADFATLKYSNAGVPLWTNRYNGPDDDYDFAQSIAVDTSGNVFVTGVSVASDFYGDYATVAYSSAGATLWERRYNAGTDSDDLPKAIALDHDGNILVTGSVGADGQFVTVKYSAPTGATSPWLSIQRIATGVVLNWTNATFGLQSSPSLADTFTNIPSATSPYTNPVSGSQRYFRLKAN